MSLAKGDPITIFLDLAIFSKNHDVLKMSKLRTYKLIKNKFGIEKKLELNDRNLRKSLTAFRISAHKSYTERGRYLNLKVEDRICNVCTVIVLR